MLHCGEDKDSNTNIDYNAFDISLRVPPRGTIKDLEGITTLERAVKLGETLQDKLLPLCSEVKTFDKEVLHNCKY